jgi:hypothetical protein
LARQQPLKHVGIAIGVGERPSHHGGVIGVVADHPTSGEQVRRYVFAMESPRPSRGQPFAPQPSRIPYGSAEQASQDVRVKGHD